jgi:hypothetical protein
MLNLANGHLSLLKICLFTLNTMTNLMLTWAFLL